MRLIYEYWPRNSLVILKNLEDFKNGFVLKYLNILST